MRIIISILFSFSLMTKKKVKKKEKKKTVATLHEEQKTCFVYISTNTGERERKISAERGKRRVKNRSQTVISAQR